MTQEIAVIGSPEFTTGFRLAGVRICENVADADKDAALDGAVERVLERDDVGIAVMHNDDLAYLSRGTREQVDLSVEPVVITIGGEAAGGLREKIKRAIGIDLMEDSD